jgi:hypothetical protein
VRKVLKLTLVVAVLLLLPWLTSIAYGNSNNASALAGVRVEAAGQAAAPEATFLGHAFGSVTPGDLFYIDATGSPHDMAVSLYITNADELTRYLRYLILRVTVYAASEDGQWRPAPLRFGPLKESDIYLTLQNSPVKFIAPGDARYKVRIDSGSYYCLPAGAKRDNERPKFYLTVETV